MFGSQLGRIAGGFLGNTVGRKFGNSGGGQKIGESIGEVAGGFLPFKNGGMVPGKKGKAKMIIAHSGEYILPIGVKPTKAQKSAVAKGKKHKKMH